MKTLRTHGLFRLVMLASMVVFCVAVGLLGTQQRAEGWSAGPLFGVTDLPYGGAHGMMAENAILWLGSNNLLPAGYLSVQDRQLLKEGASTPDGIWGVGPGLKNTWWWEGALQLESLIGRDIVTWNIFEYSCTDEPCFTFKDDWENDFDNLMNHEFADLSVWNPIKYWADKAKQDLINNNRSRAMVHAGYAMHFAEDFLNPPHLGPLLWGSYQEVDWPSELELAWEDTDFNYVPKAWSFNDFRIVARCFISDDAFPISFENDLLSYRHSTALAWPAPLPTLDWIIEQGDAGVLLDKRIVNAVMWSEQAAHEVLQYVFDLKPPGGCRPISCDFDSDLKTDIAVYRASTGAWYVKPSSGASSYGIAWGGDPSDKPVPGDYDEDGKTDIAVYRGSAGVWYIYPSGGGSPYGVGWGGDASDKPVPGDYDGDGKTDIAVYRGSTGVWYIYPSGGGSPYGVGWGIATDKPVPGDYDGDGKTDYAVYRDGAWFIYPSGGGSPYGVGWGIATDKPVPGDYDGDGKTETAVYRPNTGAWYIIPSGGASPYGMGWGGEISDVPLTTNPD